MDRRFRAILLAGISALLAGAPVAEAQVKAKAPGPNRGGSLLKRTAPRPSGGQTGEARTPAPRQDQAHQLDRARRILADRRVYPYYGYPYYGYGWYDNNCRQPEVLSYGQPYPVIITMASTPEVQPPAPAVLTVFEQAEAALRAGDASAAVRLLQDELEAPAQADADGEQTERSPEAMRLLALSLYAMGRVDESVAMVGLAYEREPTLAWNPVDEDVFGDGPRKMRSRVTDGVKHAHTVDTPSAWLLVCVLMQAEGRNGVAAKIAQRAIDAGLDEGVGRELLGVLK